MTAATTLLRLAGTPGALDHLRRLCIDDVVEMSTALLKTHLTIVHRHLLDAQISLHSVVFPRLEIFTHFCLDIPIC